MEEIAGRRAVPQGLGQKRATTRQLGGVLLAALLTGMGAIGCEWSSPGPPTRFPTTSVAGRIVAAGKPIDGGWVTFLPMDGAKGDHVVARIHSEGIFKADRVPIGKLQVRIQLPRALARELSTVSPLLAGRLALIASPGSTLRWTTTEEQGPPFEFDLVRSVVPPESL